MAVSWHLRFSITPVCNFKCNYCNPDKLFNREKPILKTSEIMDILNSTIECGISRIHWTGGEPTVRKDFIELVEFSKSIGFNEQIITTNGFRLDKDFIKELIRAGLTRVNVSLDTLDRNNFLRITGRDGLEKVTSCIENIAQSSNSITKINIVTMKNTIHEFEHFINYAYNINKKLSSNKVALKFIALSPNNPALATKSGKDFFIGETISFNEIFDSLNKLNTLTKLPHSAIDGDNPNIQYYKMGNDIYNPVIGILAMPSWDYKCGKDLCYKLRVTPFGDATICLQHGLKSLRHIEKSEIKNHIKTLMHERSILDDIAPNRCHFRTQLGEMRFGIVHSNQSSFDYKIND